VWQGEEGYINTGVQRLRNIRTLQLMETKDIKWWSALVANRGINTA
jgi:hypothetical protein